MQPCLLWVRILWDIYGSRFGDDVFEEAVQQFSAVLYRQL
jgi:hypothetical protein